MATATTDPDTALEPAGAAADDDHDGTEPLAGDVIDPDGTVVERNGQTAAFNAAIYDDPTLRIEKVDGRNIEQIAVSFSGRILLDRSNEKDVELWNRLTMGTDAELRVCAKATGKLVQGATNREGDLDVVVGTRKLKVHTVYVLTPEEL